LQAPYFEWQLLNGQLAVLNIAKGKGSGGRGKRRLFITGDGTDVEAILSWDLRRFGR